METVDYISVSALQHYAFCPRQFALIHIEQLWAENRYTAEGNLLHEKVDSGFAEQRLDKRSERSVLIKSQQYKITGKMDLLEITSTTPPLYFPVEYKRGKPKIQDWDRIQLCAQALCIEEMRDTVVNEGAIWYWEARHREKVKLDAKLRETTVEIIKQAHDLLSAGRTPSPTENKKRCGACSLIDLCEPGAFRSDHSKEHVKALFSVLPGSR